MTGKAIALRSVIGGLIIAALIVYYGALLEGTWCDIGNAFKGPPTAWECARFALGFYAFLFVPSAVFSVTLDALICCIILGVRSAWRRLAS